MAPPPQTALRTWAPPVEPGQSPCPERKECQVCLGWCLGDRWLRDLSFPICKVRQSPVRSECSVRQSPGMSALERPGSRFTRGGDRGVQIGHY